MQIEILDHVSALKKEELVDEESHIWISVIEPLLMVESDISLKPNKNRVDHLVLSFFDTEDENDCFSFCDNCAEKIVNFVDKNKSNVNKIYINCIKGESRSVGIALGLIEKFNLKPIEIKKSYRPNKLVIRKIGEVWWKFF